MSSNPVDKWARGLSNILRRAVTAEFLLRVSLRIVYLCFGALKLVGMSPVLELVRRSYPPFATMPLYVALALFELILGMALLLGVWKRWASVAVMLHLIGTFGVLVSAPQLVFLPGFPFLTMEGEFVVKDLVLLGAAGALWVGMSKEPSSVQPRAHQWMLGLFLICSAALGFATPYLHQSLRAAHQSVRLAAAGVKAPEPVPTQTTAAAVRAITGAGIKSSLLLHGEVVDRCRLLGCWLRLRDRTGELFVDLAPAGLSARRIPVGSGVRVAGHVGKTREGEPGFVASAVGLVREGPGL